MNDTAQTPRYVVISPVKDEARFIERTLHSVAAQSVRPARWVLVDDGSEDGTGEILKGFAAQHAWVKVVTRPRGGARQPGSAVMRAFQAGFEQVRHEEFDFVVKLDCDLELDSDYFSRLFEKFQQDPHLGIASGVYLEEHGGHWEPIPMPPYHASGASKVIRARCFSDIEGFAGERGWDTVDEIRAQVRGWHTRHFVEIQFRHLKPEGSGIGDLRTSIMHGEVYYSTGGGFLFLLLKVFHRMVKGKPVLLGGLALLWGYLRCLLAGRRMMVSKKEARFYRRQLNRRIWESLGRVFGRVPKKEVWGMS